MAAFHRLFDFDHQTVSSVFASLQTENIRIACNLERAGHVNSPGGYLRDLTAKARRGSAVFEAPRLSLSLALSLSLSLSRARSSRRSVTVRSSPQSLLKLEPVARSLHCWRNSPAIIGYAQPSCWYVVFCPSCSMPICAAVIASAVLQPTRRSCGVYQKNAS
nr:replication initiation protein RepC [Sinorhizobium meliloti]